MKIIENQHNPYDPKSGLWGAMFRIDFTLDQYASPDVVDSEIINHPDRYPCPFTELIQRITNLQDSVWREL